MADFPEELKEQEMAKKARYVYFLYPPFISWLEATAEFTYTDPQVRTVKSALKDEGTYLAVGFIMALNAMYSMVQHGNMESISALLSAGSFAKAALNARAARKSDAFTARPAETDKIKERRDLHIDNYLIQTPEEYMSNQFKKVKQYWDLNMPGFAFKLVPSVIKKLNSVEELEMQKQEAFKHYNCDKQEGRTPQEITAFLHTTEGVRVEDKYSRRQIKILSEITGEYLEAANRENRKKHGNSDEYQKLIDTYDILDQAIKNYTGSNFWMGEEPVDQKEQAFSYSRFFFDINQEKIYKRINESKFNKAYYSEAHKELDKINGTVVKIVGKDGIKQNAFVLGVDSALDSNKFAHNKKEEERENNFNTDKCCALTTFRACMRELNELENQKVDIESSGDFIAGYTFDRIFRQQKRCVKKLADTLNATGYYEESRLVKLCGISAEDLYYDFGKGAEDYSKITERGLIIPDEKTGLLKRTADAVKTVPKKAKNVLKR